MHFSSVAAHGAEIELNCWCAKKDGTSNICPSIWLMGCVKMMLQHHSHHVPLEVNSPTTTSSNPYRWPWMILARLTVWRLVESFSAGKWWLLERKWPRWNVWNNRTSLVTLASELHWLLEVLSRIKHPRTVRYWCGSLGESMEGHVHYHFFSSGEFQIQ